MNESVPKLRMFAGPNGSGKSTLKSYLPQKLLGVYLNPDDVEREMRASGIMDFTQFGCQPTKEQIGNFFAGSTLLKEVGLREEARKVVFQDGFIEFGEVNPNSYFASVAVEFLRHELLRRQISFTFETVMSHRSKVEFLVEARQAGYRTYLYYVATDDPAINISRVRNRVKLGGHPVPSDKVVERYYRSLDLLMEAVRAADRAYIFDNSGDSSTGKQTWLAEITEGRRLELKTSEIPAWFKRAVLESGSYSSSASFGEGN